MIIGPNTTQTPSEDCFGNLSEKHVITEDTKLLELESNGKMPDGGGRRSAETYAKKRLSPIQVWPPRSKRYSSQHGGCKYFLPKTIGYNERVVPNHRYETTEGANDTPTKTNFTNKINELGVGFSHDALPVSTVHPKHSMPYFHYGGVATADINQDGWQDLYFLNHHGANELWMNQNGKRFQKHQSDKIGVPGEFSSGVAFGDIDNDGDPDMYVTTLGGRNRLLENTDGGFKDITSGTGTGYEGYSSSAVFFDHNNDGLLDLYVVNLANFSSGIQTKGGYGIQSANMRYWPERWAEPNLLYINQGNGSFRQIETRADFPTDWSHDALLVPNPGSTPGLYVTTLTTVDRVLGYSLTGRLTDDERFGKLPVGSMGGSVLDYDNDGNLDLYVAEKISDMKFSRDQRMLPRLMREDAPSEPFNNTFGKNSNLTDEGLFGSALYDIDNGSVQEVSDETGAETYLPWGVSSGDVNMDGYIDLFVTGGQQYRQYVPDALLLNNGSGGFEKAGRKAGINPPEESIFTTWYSVDCSNRRNADELCSRLDLNTTSGVVVKNFKSSRGSVLVDIDNDGDLDIVTNVYNGRPRILENKMSQHSNRNYVKIKLEGETAPPDGTGAVVSLQTSDSKYHRFVDGKSGLTAQSRKPIHFGLDADESPEKVTVTWPTGGINQYDIESNNEVLSLKQR